MSLFKRYRPHKDRPSASNENAKADLLEALAGMTGVDFFIDSAGAHFRRPRPRARLDFWAEITASDPMSGQTNRWQYAWREKLRTGIGWETKDGGRTGTVSSNFALNSAEANNAATGIMGNGIDHDNDYPAGFEMQPIRGSRIVRMYEEQNTTGGTSYTFEASNAEQGPCEEEA